MNKYVLSIANVGTVTSQQLLNRFELAKRYVSEVKPEEQKPFNSLVGIVEHSIAYTNQDFDVMSAAYRALLTVEARALPQKLAALAVGRASLEAGCRTARACGDSEWAEDNAHSLQDYDHAIETLKAQATPEQIREARDITNAAV